MFHVEQLMKIIHLVAFFIVRSFLIRNIVLFLTVTNVRNYRHLLLKTGNPARFATTALMLKTVYFRSVENFLNFFCISVETAVIESAHVSKVSSLF